MTSTYAVEISVRGALAMISDAHCAATLADPRWKDIASESNPALQLAWIVRQGLMTCDDLDDLLSFGEEETEQDRIIEEAFAELGR